MTKLSPLRSRLADLRRRRQAVRWGAGYSAFGLAVLWTLVAAFVVDWSLEMSRLWRILSLAVCVVVIAWATRKFTLPWLGHRESELDLALMVERQQRIDSDLVAAIQFESPEAPRWGSVQLEQAVIGYVADFSKGWNILEGFSRQDLVRRASALAATIGLLVVASAIFPGHAKAFLNRLLLGSAHYPTHTHIERVLVNGEPIDLKGDRVVKLPYGMPLEIAVHGSGELPEKGRAELEMATGQTRTTVDLARDRADGVEAVYLGKHPKLIDTIVLDVYLGDAWTDPAQLVVVPLPNVEAELTVTPPPYAVSPDAAPASATSSRQLAVIEGSRVDLAIYCTNKSLRDAVLTIADKKHPMVPAPEGQAWWLDTAGSPLAQVEKPIKYQIQVTDEDGLQLEHPLEGFIRIKADQRPRITGHMVTHDVLSDAQPRIDYAAMDDYGIAKLLVHLEVTRDGSLADDQPAPLPLAELKEPVLKSNLPIKGTYRLKLSPFALKKGDQVKVTLEAVDFRGELAGQPAMSEPFLLQVTDESGALAGILEADQKSVRQLDAINKRQLGIGDSK